MRVSRWKKLLSFVLFLLLLVPCSSYSEDSVSEVYIRRNIELSNMIRDAQEELKNLQSSLEEASNWNERSRVEIEEYYSYTTQLLTRIQELQKELLELEAQRRDLQSSYNAALKKQREWKIYSIVSFATGALIGALIVRLSK